MKNARWLPIFGGVLLLALVAFFFSSRPGGFAAAGPAPWAWLFLLACPLMHLLMMGGHHHHHHGEHKPGGDREPGAAKGNERL